MRYTINKIQPRKITPWIFQNHRKVYAPPTNHLTSNSAPEKQATTRQEDTQNPAKLPPEIQKRRRPLIPPPKRQTKPRSIPQRTHQKRPRKPERPLRATIQRHRKGLRLNEKIPANLRNRSHPKPSQTLYQSAKRTAHRTPQRKTQRTQRPMSEKITSARSRLSQKIYLTVSTEELQIIDRKQKELGIQSRTDFLRTAIENLVGEKFFRQRIHDKPLTWQQKNRLSRVLTPRDTAIRTSS